MRLLDLHIIAFGCFTDERLVFSEAGTGFHVIYGPNEAGKSTAMRALTDFLYGIPGKTPDAFLHDMKSLRVAATLERFDGRRCTFVRRKGSNNTLLGRGDKPVPESQLSEFLGGTSKEVFDAMFGLDHTSLRRGGDELLEGKGDVAESLYQAGTGISGLRRVLEAIKEEADVLFTPRSSKALINRAITDYENARSLSRDRAVPPKRWNEQRDALKTAEEEQNEVKVRVQELSERKERLNRFRWALPHVTRRSELRNELEALGPLTVLLDSATRGREDAQRRLDDARRQKQRAESKLADLGAELERLNVPQELLTHARDIELINQQLVKYRDAVHDLPVVRAEELQFANEATTILHEVKPGLPLGDAETLRLPVVQSTRIRGLAGKHGELQERLRSATGRTESACLEWESMSRALEETAAPKDAGELERALERARKQGDPEAMVQAQSGELVTAKKQAAVALERLTLWNGTLEQLETLPVPALETVDRFDREWDDLDKERAILTGNRNENRQRAGEIDAEIRAVQIGQAVPTEEELLLTRDRRERYWNRVRLVWLEGGNDPELEGIADPNRSLAKEYEASVSDADATADRLRREAARVARLAGLLADREGRARKADELETALSKLTQRREAWRRRWREAWQPAGITPLSPKEMRGWLSRQTALMSEARDMSQRGQSITQLEQRIQEHAGELDRALRALGVSGRGKFETLSGLLQRGESFLQQLRNAAQQRADLERDVVRLAGEREKATGELRRAQDEIDGWRNDWQQALAPLGLPADTRVDEAMVVLDRLDSLFAKLKDIEDRRVRVEQMERHISQFDQDVCRLMQTLAPDLEGLTPAESAARLQSLLTKAQQEAARRNSLEEQFKEVQKVLDGADADSKKAEEELNDLMAMAHCSDLASLHEAELKSARARDLLSQINTINNTLIEFTAGATLDAFLTEVLSMNADDLPFEIGEIENELKKLGDRRSELDQRIGSERATLTAMDGSNEVVIAVTDAQSALARVRAGTERYFRLRLAGEILRVHIERYREQNQDPIIKRAGEIFPRLTCGSFARLKTDFDDKDRPVLLGVRSSGEEVDIAGMSDGTRDQLFLGLRLASLERQLTSGEPLPFVVDDVLVNFDDFRAEATLIQLADLARHTQVLFFTHHARLVELAKKVLPENLLQVHTLGTT